MDGDHQPNTPQTRPLTFPWFGSASIAFAFVVAAALSWRKWPDPLIDFGTQLYLPWKISTGSVLYHDVSYLTGGPLSQNFNALLFKLFGASFTTLIVSNLALIGILLTLVYRRFKAAADSWTATMLCLGIVLGFAFAQYGDIGNYNYVTPYCHEIFHGLLLSIVALVCLSDLVMTTRLRFAAGAGFCAGLVFLTKPEVFAALFVGCVFALALCFRQRTVSALKALGLVCGSFALPNLGFLFYFHHSASWKESLRSVLFAWSPLLQSSISNGFYYRWCMGLDAPAHHVRMLLLYSVALAALLAGYAFALKRMPQSNRLGPLLITTPLLALAGWFDWTTCGYALPLVTFVALVVLGLKIWKSGINAGPIFPFLWCVFALGLLAKLGVFCRIWHYGFVLAMPAFVAAIYLLVWLLPLALEKIGVPRMLFRAGISATLLVGFAFLFMQSELRYRQKTVSIGQGGDTIYAFNEKTGPAGVAMQAALNWVSNNAPANAALAVLPEGVMLNYLSRRTNPTRYLVWNPAEEEAFGQSNMFAAFTNGSPDIVMLVERDAAEYGVKPFGQEKRFGLELMEWLGRNYQPVYLIGHEPFQRDQRFGIKILRKSPNSSAAKPGD